MGRGRTWKGARAGVELSAVAVIGKFLYWKVTRKSEVHSRTEKDRAREENLTAKEF